MQRNVEPGVSEESLLLSDDGWRVTHVTAKDQIDVSLTTGPGSGSRLATVVSNGPGYAGSNCESRDGGDANPGEQRAARNSGRSGFSGAGIRLDDSSGTQHHRF